MSIERTPSHIETISKQKGNAIKFQTSKAHTEFMVIGDSSWYMFIWSPSLRLPIQIGSILLAPSESEVQIKCPSLCRDDILFKCRSDDIIMNFSTLMKQNWSTWIFLEKVFINHNRFTSSKIIIGQRRAVWKPDISIGFLSTCFFFYFKKKIFTLLLWFHEMRKSILICSKRRLKFTGKWRKFHKT